MKLLLEKMKLKYKIIKQKKMTKFYPINKAILWENMKIKIQQIIQN